MAILTNKPVASASAYRRIYLSEHFFPHPKEETASKKKKANRSASIFDEGIQRPIAPARCGGETRSRRPYRRGCRHPGDGGVSGAFSREKHSPIPPDFIVDDMLELAEMVLRDR